MKKSYCNPAIWASIAVIFLSTGIAARTALQESSQTETLIAVAESLVPAVARLRGLEPKASIQKGIKSRAEISQYLNEGVDRHYEKTVLNNEGLLLKRLGLIPSSMDYADFTLKLLSEQVGGYYDPEKKALFVAGWLPAEEQKAAIVHELTHALQDQYFDLQGIMEKDRKSHNDDLVLAHQAVAEGDATAVMLDYMLEPMGMTFFNLPNLTTLMRAQMATMPGQSDLLNHAPDFIKETLVFPYSYGTAFLQQMQVRNRRWPEVNKIYSDLPASTEQILHPDKYFGVRDNPKDLEPFDPSAPLGKTWEIAYRNVWGEFSLYLLLKSQLPDELALQSCQGWGGDRVILLAEKGSSRSAVLIDSVWDNPESAGRFSTALSTWILKKFPQGRKVAESEQGFGWVYDGEGSALFHRGTCVRMVVGLPEEFAGKFFGSQLDY
jgi:hypothetical protein